VAFIDLKILYPRSEFVLLPVEQEIRKDLFMAFVAPMVWSVPIIGFDVLPDGAVVQWAAVPSTADLLQMANAIATYPGGETSSSPLQVEALAVADNAATDLVDVIDVTTPPRDAGTYQILCNCQIGLAVTVANAGARVVATFSRIRGAAIVSRPYEHAWNLSQPQLFSPDITFECEAGDQIRARLQFQRIGVAAIARLSNARITIDQLAAAG
jgi:hypothetical protein